MCMESPLTQSILEHEIYEQPQVIEQLLAEEVEQVQQIAASVRGSSQYVLIAARGSSDNAARYAQYLFGAHNHLQVALATPSLFTIYRQPPRLDGALVLAVSQSGQSPDIVEVVAEGRRQGRPTIAITNDPASPLAQAAEHIIQLHAGQERAVAATKTYTASLAALALFSALLEENSAHLELLARLPEHLCETLARLDNALARAERYRYMAHCAVIGRGYNYATACEVALKIKELTRTVAESYSPADFRHGPVAMVQPGFPVLVIAPSGAVSDDLHALVSELRQRGSELLVISDERALLDAAHLPLPVAPAVPEWLTPLIAVIPGQLFGHALALSRSLDPDQPAGLSKVTETL